MISPFAVASIVSLALGLKLSYLVQNRQLTLTPNEGLAEIGADASNLTCTFGEDRNKAALVDFWGIL